MSCTNVPRMLVDRSFAVPADIRHGLLAAATVVDDMDPHGIHGLEYIALCDPAVKPYPVGDCPDSPRPTKEGDRSLAVASADAFALYAAETCPATASGVASGRSRIQERFLAGEQHALEMVVNNGWAGARPFLRDPDGAILNTGAPLPLHHAVGALEHRLAAFGLPATIHAPRWTAAVMDELGIIYRDSAGARTFLGSRVVFGSGYDGAPPEGQPDGQLWLYATGPVTVSRSRLIQPATPNTGAFDPSTNTTFVLMERVYVVDWPCQTVAVATTLEPLTGLFPVPPLPPVPPELTVEPSTGTAPLEVAVSVTHPDGPDTVEVDLGDGSALARGDTPLDFTHTYATPGVYTVTVTSLNSSLSTQVTVQVDAPPAPPAPTNLSATADSPTTVALAWEWTGDNITAFELWACPNGAAPGSAQCPTPITVPSTDRTTTVPDLTPNTPYTFTLHAVYAGVQSTPATATATTPPLPVADPTGVAASGSTPTSLTVAWEWEQGTGQPATGFQVRYRTPAGTGAWSAPQTVDGGDRSMEITGLATGTEYEVGVTATGATASSAETTATGSTLPAPVSDPTGVLFVGGAGFADVRWEWEQGTGPQTTGFEVRYRTPVGTGAWSDPQTAAITAREVEITGLTADTEYEAGVTALSSTGRSTEVTATGSTLPAP